jgi:glycosyltransferase involved in cell wall biosynthesis
MPLVSVVIPSRDRSRLALLAIRSVCAQRDVDLEVILVDDGSSDGTNVAVESVFHSAVRVLRHDRPLGVATARNAGTEAARAPWIALLDDDDLWSPDKLKRQMDALDASRRDWVYAGVVEIDEQGRYRAGSPPPSPSVLLTGLRKRNLMPAGSSNVIIRADLLREVGGFDRALRHLADWDLWLRLAGHGAPACVPAPLVAYRVHDEQASMDTAGMIAEAELLEARHGADRGSIDRWIAWSHLRHGHRREAVQAYARAFAAGDIASIGRAAVAAVYPRAVDRRRRRSTPESLDWRRQAEIWLPEAVS